MLVLVAALVASHYVAAQTIPTPGDKTIALFNAIRSGSSAELRTQLANGASANDSLNGYSALMAAALSGSADQMKELVEHGANVDYQASNGVTALWLAVPDREKTKLLLDKGADPNHIVQGYGMLVKLAAMPGTIDLFHLLVDKGADLKKMAPDNFLLYNAASSGDTSVLGFLIRSGSNVNDTVAFGDYPINNAEAFRSFPALKMLIDNGANVNVRVWVPFGLDAFKGFTPLMYASLGNDKPSILYLLEHGADPNARNMQGYTPLMILEQSECDDPEIIEAFIKHGANITQEAPDETDALYYARQKGKTASVALLEKYFKQ